jgi:hypothetical protein
MPRKPLPPKTTFAALLTKLVDAKFDSRRAFIRAAESRAAEHSAQAYLSQVVAGKKPPPIERIDAWADALELKAKDRERFIDLACIAHLPLAVQPHFEKILSRLETAEEFMLSMTKGKR